MKLNEIAENMPVILLPVWEQETDLRMVVLYYKTYQEENQRSCICNE